MESVIGLCYDTTNANTGIHNGTVTLLSKLLPQPVFQNPCRRHIGKTLLRHVWNECEIEPSTGPNFVIFKKFQDIWEFLDLTNESENLHLPLKGEYQEVACRLQSLQQSTSVRDDYKEAIDLSLMYLTGKQTSSIRRPGALTQARFMCKILYSLKIVMLSKVIGKQANHTEIMTSEQLQNIQKFTDFTVIVYMKWWVECSVASAAPRTDLQLLIDIHQYQPKDTVLASAALKAFKRHQNYLEEEMVPLCLFDINLNNQEKHEVATKIIQVSIDFWLSNSCFINHIN